jgi:hypothetical protein
MASQGKHNKTQELILGRNIIPHIRFESQVKVLLKIFNSIRGSE